MQDRLISIAAVEEPRNDIASQGNYPVGVQLNFELADDTVIALDPAGEFTSFLDALTTAAFAAYALDPGNTKLTLVSTGWLDLIGGAPSGAAKVVGDWLDQPAGTTPTVWLNRDNHHDGQIGGAASALSAGQRLAGAQTWPGPLPQTAGLTQLVEVPGAPTANLYIVAAFQNGALPAPDTEIALDGPPDGSGQVEITRSADALGDVTMRIAPIELISANLLMIDRATGFLELDDDSFVLVALIHRIRQRAGSLFWTAPHLIGAPATATGQQRGKALVWRVATILCSIFDTLFLTLAMPGPEEREGPIVGAVLAATSDTEAPPDPQGEQTYTQAIKDWVAVSANGGQGNRRTNFVVLAARLLGKASLKDAIGQVPIRDISPDIAKSAELLPQLLNIFCNGADATWPEGTDFIALEARADAELAPLITYMGSEAGFEASILAVLREDSMMRALLALVHGDKGRADKALLAVATAYSSGYNALEAARKAVGSLFASTLVRKGTRAGAEDLARTLVTSDWFTTRIGPQGPDGVFAELLEKVPLVHQGWATPSAVITRQLTESFVEACADLGAGDAAERRRFVTDTHPADIAVRLPVDLLDTSGDSFGKIYDGLSLLVRRDATHDWAHANLATLIAGGPHERLNVPVAILPIQPAQIDGETQVAHSFAGKPFALARPAPASDDDCYPPFFRSDMPDATQVGGAWPAAFAKVPALAYGLDIDIAAFAVSRSGVLPENASLPAGSGPRHFLAPAETPDPVGQFVTYKYSRKTGIGQTTIERLADTQPDAFQAPLEKIQPLSTDYPHVSVALPGAGRRWLDLWRGPNGAGTIALPQATPVKLVLADVRAAGTATLNVSVMSDPRGIETDRPIQFALDTVKPGSSIELAIMRTADGCVLSLFEQDAPFRFDPNEPVWICLTLEAPGPGPASLALADVRGSVTGKAGGEPHAAKDLLVLRPDEPGWRQDEFATRAHGRIAPPSMGIDDFDRWMSNPALYAREVDGQDSKLGDFYAEILGINEELAASGPAAFFAGGSARALADLLQANAGFLPDLAVDGLIVELALVDTFGTKAWSTPSLSVKMDLPRLGALLQQIGYVSGHPERTLPALQKQRRIDLTIESSKTDQIELVAAARTITARVPAGCVARLTVRPIIRSEWFDRGTPVIVPALRQYAVGQVDLGATYDVFEGTGLTIETMQAPLLTWDEKLVPIINAGLDLTAVEGARSYQLIANPQGLPWRQVGTADLATQRWRPSGRPIYSWFRPRDNRHIRDRGGETIVRLAGTTRVNDFEAQTFDSDLAQAQRVRVQPLGAQTVFHSGTWETPSATLFRHRLTLRGRYADALANDKGARWIVIGDKLNDPARPDTLRTIREPWLRVAVLAERSRIQLARPQLRALMPLNRAVTDDASPPVLAMLAEPPFAQGGLADRVAASVVLGIGYEMQDKPTRARGRGRPVPADPPEQQLAVGDVRQEAGKDPLLTFTALPIEVARRLYLNAEGPLGLTFDDTGTASAFANSAWALSSRLLGSNADYPDWQEHFLGISMHRYLDPDWLAVAPNTTNMAPRTGDYAFEETRWFEFDKDMSVICGRAIATLSRTGPHWRVEINGKAILREQPTDKAVTAWEFADNAVMAIAFLHQPLDANRAALTVFAVRDQSLGPVALGTVNWQTENVPASPLQFAIADAADPTFFQRVAPQLSALTAASAPTSGEWVRTGRDFDKAIGTPTGGGATIDYAVASLGMASTTKGLVRYQSRNGEELWLRPSGHDDVTMLSLQRFLAVIHTRVVVGKGREIEAFGGAQNGSLLIGPDLTLPSPTKRDRTRILEIELPARPLTAHPDALGADLNEYRLTKFDLRETRQTNAKSFILLIKPYIKARARGGYALDLTVTSPSLKAVYSFTFGDSGPQQLVIAHADGATKAWALDERGVAATIEGKVTAPPDSYDPVKLSVAAKTADEWWADVSTLALAAPLPNNITLASLPFDFGWLFGNSETPLESALSHPALRDVAGAQARVVSVSPPIGLFTDA